LAMQLGQTRFSWGSAEFIPENEMRQKYLAALRTADAGEIQPLLKFARS